MLQGLMSLWEIPASCRARRAFVRSLARELNYPTLQNHLFYLLYLMISDRLVEMGSRIKIWVLGNSSPFSPILVLMT